MGNYFWKIFLSMYTLSLFKTTLGVYFIGLWENEIWKNAKGLKLRSTSLEDNHKKQE